MPQRSPLPHANKKTGTAKEPVPVGQSAGVDWRRTAPAGSTLRVTHASQNAFGDVKVSQRTTALRGTVVRCGTDCRFGNGWLAFAKGPSLTASDVVSAKAHSGRIGWSVDLGLTARGQTRWTAFSKVALQRERSSGVPDVLAVVVGGEILALPYASDVRYKNGTLELVGFYRAAALRAAKSLG